MSVDDFFKENVVQNLAALLRIKPDNIRVMQVVSTGATRKRRNVEGSSEMTVSRAFWKMLEVLFSTLSNIYDEVLLQK